jgi:hypothetical protein
VAALQKRQTAAAVADTVQLAEMHVAATLAEALGDAQAKLLATTDPAAEMDRLRAKYARAVPKAEPGWWVAKRLGELIVFGRNRIKLDEGSVDALVVALHKRIAAGREGDDEVVRNPPGYFLSMCREAFRASMPDVDWNAKGRYHKRE